MSTQIAIASEECKKDGLCVKVCPVRIFTAAEGQLPSIHDAEHCVLCGQCLAVCPSNCITHSRLEQARLSRIEDRKPVEGSAMVEHLRQRRSVRVYKPVPVERELLERIASVAAYAPTSAHGGEGWVRSVTLVSGAADMSRVLEFTVQYMDELRRLLRSPMVRLVAKLKIEPRRARSMLHDMDMRLSEHGQGRDAVIYGAPAAAFVHTPETTPEPHADGDSALFSMMLAAHAFGLGTCWNGWIAKAADAFKVKRATGLRRMLQIPEHHTVVAAMTLGYPAVKLHSVPQREVAVHWPSASGS